MAGSCYCNKNWLKGPVIQSKREDFSPFFEQLCQHRAQPLSRRQQFCQQPTSPFFCPFSGQASVIDASSMSNCPVSTTPLSMQTAMTKRLAAGSFLPFLWPPSAKDSTGQVETFLLPINNLAHSYRIFFFFSLFHLWLGIANQSARWHHLLSFFVVSFQVFSAELEQNRKSG